VKKRNDNKQFSLNNNCKVKRVVVNYLGLKLRFIFTT